MLRGCSPRRYGRLALFITGAAFLVSINLQARPTFARGDSKMSQQADSPNPVDITSTAKFTPGQTLKDTDGKPIQAHGGGMMVDIDGTYYWYGENKDGKTYQPDPRFPDRVDVIGVSCYSSTDLHTWKNEGVVLPASPDANSDLHYDRVVERPKVVRNDKTNKYVMWMHIDNQMYQYARAGVATSDSPTGPFEYLGSVSPHGFESRDVTVFKDDDGTAYIIYSSENNMVTHIGPLSDDYLTIPGPYIRTMVNLSREAPAVFKNNGVYYMVNSGCSGWAPNRAEAFAAREMMGTWQSLGDPMRGGTKEERATTFRSQSTFVVPLPGLPGRFLFMADRWNQYDLQDSRYVWLPMWVAEPHLGDPVLETAREEERHLWASVVVRWFDSWSLAQLAEHPQ